MAEVKYEAPIRAEYVYGVSKDGLTKFVLPAAYDARIASQRKAAQAELRKTGFAALCNTAGENELTGLHRLFWDYVETINPNIKRDDHSTCNNKEWPGFFSVGIFKWYGIGHSSFLWAVRCLVLLLVFWSEMFDTDRLLTSFDGCGVIRGWEHNYEAVGAPQKPKKKKEEKKEEKKKKEPVEPKVGWRHVDQNLNILPERNTSYQGGFNVIDAADPRTHGGFAYVPYSSEAIHTRFHQKTNLSPFNNRHGANTHYNPLEASDPLNKVQRVVCGAMAGDYIMWDSTTVHENYHPLCTPDKATKKRKTPPPKDAIVGRLRRLTAYVPFSAASKVLEHGVKGLNMSQFMRARMRTIAQGFTTPHWPFYTFDKENAMIYPRASTSTPLEIPLSCKNRHLSPTESALAFGTPLPASALGHSLPVPASRKRKIIQDDDDGEVEMAKSRRIEYSDPDQPGSA